MSPELDKKLCEEFPSIFRNRDGDMRKTCMCWGFECGDGWYNIIRGLCLSLTYNYETSKDLKLDGRVKPENMKYDDPDFDSYFWRHTGAGLVIADQVKEKYGTLRFYYRMEWSEQDQKMAELYPNTAAVIAAEQRNYVEGIMCMAETMSAITCEETGLIGELHISGGWYRTLNVDIAKSEKYADRGFITLEQFRKDYPQ